MMRRPICSIFVGTAAIAIAAAVFPHAAAADTPAPAAVPATRPAVPSFPMLDRFVTSLAHVDMSPAQRTKVDALIGDYRAKLSAAVKKDAADARDTVRDDTIEFRRQLASVLRPPQLQQLRDQMQAQRRDPDPPAGNAPPSGAPPVLPSTPKPGDALPDFALSRLDGGLSRKPSFHGRVLIIEFGSITSPSFRERAPAMEQLRAAMAERVDLLTVYTAEAHPTGGWEVERNKSANISAAQSTTLADRQKLAERARDTLKMHGPIAIDGLGDDSFAAKVDAGENTAIVVARDGTIALYQHWCDPDGLRRAAEAAIAVPLPPATQP